MPFGDSTIIGCVARTLAAAGLDPIVAVAGANRSEIEAALSDTPARIVANPRPDRGMLSSIQIGLAALPAAVGRFVIALGDQPRISAADVTQLLEAQIRSGKGILLPTHRGKRGHPILFDARYRVEIMALRDTQTLRDVVHAHADDIAEVGFASDAFLCDIDTREQYEDERRHAQ
jgi:molybdenum cofactor cytidylyltransferase